MAGNERNGSRPGKPRKRAKARAWMIYPDPAGVPDGWRTLEGSPFLLVRDAPVPNMAELALISV